MRRYNSRGLLSLFFLTASLLVACTAGREAATPVETFKTYVKAVKQKDTTTMKLLLSSETMKMHEQEAKAQNTTVDELLKRDDLLGDGQTTVEYRNEKIDGDKATLEYRNSAKMWETIAFLRENDEWKIDKKNFADQMIRDIEQNSEQFDEMLNRGRPHN
jgi:hypothetical protein